MHGRVLPTFWASSVARPGGRDDASIVPYKSFAMFAAYGKVSPRRGEGTPPYCANKCTVIYTSVRGVGDAAPYKQFVGSSQFFNMQWGQVSAGSGDPAFTGCFMFYRPL